MSTTRIVVGILWVGLTVPGVGSVCSQDYPNKPLRIVTAGAGGGGDFVARQIAQGIAVPLGQPVVVDNRTSILAPDAVAKAPPDGYTLLVVGNAFWLASLLQDVPYDPVKHFSPITMAEKSPLILVVHPSVPAKSVKELIALAKARPGELNFASGSTGSASHLAGELFKTMAGIKMTHVPYKSAGPIMLDLISGNVQLTFGGSAPVLPHVNSGKLRGLAVTSSQTFSAFPGLPTMAASGLPGYEAAGITGVFAPAKTPTAIINRLNQEILRVISTAEAKERFLTTGAEVVGTTPEALAAYVKSDMATMGKLIKDAGLRTN